MTSSKLTNRRNTVKRPRICATAAAYTGAPTTPGAKPCTVQILYPNPPDAVGQVVINACGPCKGQNQDIETFDLTLNPPVPGFWELDPLNCEFDGIYQFTRDPPPGPLQATCSFTWPDGSSCVNSTIVIIPP